RLHPSAKRRESYWLAWVGRASWLPAGRCEAAWSQIPLAVLEGNPSPWKVEEGDMSSVACTPTGVWLTALRDYFRTPPPDPLPEAERGSGGGVFETGIEGDGCRVSGSFRVEVDALALDRGVPALLLGVVGWLREVWYRKSLP